MDGGAWRCEVAPFAEQAAAGARYMDDTLAAKAAEMERRVSALHLRSRTLGRLRVSLSLTLPIGNTVRSFPTHGQQSAAKRSSTTVSRSSAHGLVRFGPERALLTGAVPLFTYHPPTRRIPLPSVSHTTHPLSCIPPHVTR